MEKNQQQSQYEAPVPASKHYEVLKDVENRIKERLSELEHRQLLIGLRVAYGIKPLDDVQSNLEHKMDFGYLGPLDSAINCGCNEDEEFTESEWGKIVNDSRIAIPIPMLDSLYDTVLASFQEQTDLSLCIAIDIVLYGSLPECTSIRCTCGNNRKRYCVTDRNGKTTCGCTTKPC